MNYLKNKKNGKILNLLLSLIAIFVIIFIICWVTKKGTKVDYDEIFSENLTTMNNVAKKYFSNDLPNEVKDEKRLTLSEMYNLKLIDKLTYKNSSCDENKSYISITKTSLNDFQVKSYLICSDKEDNIIEKIQVNNVIEDTNGNIIADDKKDDVQINNNGSTSTIYCTSTRVCDIIEIPTKCTTTYEYEYIKRNASCPNGYYLSNGICVKNTDQTVNPSSKEIITNASINPGTTYKRYVDPIVTSTDSYYKCESGILSGKYCYNYKDKIVTSTTKCNDGSTPVNGKCTVTTDPITTFTCSNGSTPINGKCITYTAPTTTSTCSNGSNPVNGKCITYSTPTTTTSCSDGSTPVNGKCTTYSDPTTSTSCPDGYTPNGSSKCEKSVSAVKSYTAWGNPDSVYQTTTPESTYTSELSKKVLTGTNKVGVTTIYTYAIYSRSIYYDCAEGTLNGTRCIVSTKPTTTTKCTTGTLVNGKCESYSNPSTTTKCTTGTLVNGKCESYSNPTTSTKCSTGSLVNGKCVNTYDPTTTSVSKCPDGYTDDGTKCYVRTNAIIVAGIVTYSCPNGFTQEGKQCYITETNASTYYCESATATLKGNMCYDKSAANVCPENFTYSTDDKLCHKPSNETTNPIYSVTDRVYSFESILPGYQKTGRAKYKTTCTAITPEITK